MQKWINVADDDDTITNTENVHDPIILVSFYYIQCTIFNIRNNQ